MKRFEEFLISIFTGIGIGAVVCTVTMAAMGGMDATLKQVLVWVAASATVGTFLHYSSDWISSARVMLPAFIIIYVIIYVAIFLVRLAETKELNKKLKEPE